MYALSDEDRQNLIRLAFMIVCGGMAILPFTVRPTSPAARAQVPNRTSMITVPDVPGRLEYPTISVDRDPFVADVAALSPPVLPSRAISNSESGDEIGIVLPPNEGARGTPPYGTSASAVPMVHGIVLGEAAQALVDFGSGIKVVSVGDHVGSETVRSIDANGVTLSSGLRLRITDSPR